MVNNPYNSHKTSNLCCSERQSIYNCLIPSTFNSSCFNSKELASGTSLSAYSRTSVGKVAENNTN